MVCLFVSPCGKESKKNVLKKYPPLTPATAALHPNPVHDTDLAAYRQTRPYLKGQESPASQCKSNFPVHFWPCGTNPVVFGRPSAASPYRPYGSGVSPVRLPAFLRVHTEHLTVV